MLEVNLSKHAYVLYEKLICISFRRYWHSCVQDNERHCEYGFSRAHNISFRLKVLPRVCVIGGLVREH